MNLDCFRQAGDNKIWLKVRWVLTDSTKSKFGKKHGLYKKQGVLLLKSEKNKLIQENVIRNPRRGGVTKWLVERGVEEGLGDVGRQGGDGAHHRLGSRHVGGPLAGGKVAA